MIARNGITPVTIPQPCSQTTGLGNFSRDVISALKALRDRRVIYEVSKSTSPTTIVPLHILGDRPPYIAAAAAPAEGYKRYYIEWGTLNEQIASNWDDYFDINSTTYFFAVATLRTTSTLLVTSWTIATGAAIDSEETADWAVDATRPAEAVTVLGAVTVDVDGVHSISNFGGGSLRLTEHISNIEAGTTAGDVLLGKQLTFSRLTY